VAHAPGTTPATLSEPAWAIKTFELDSLPDDRTAELSFEALPGAGEVWLNDQPAHHTGWQ
jgi:hypothetical protein